MALVAYNRGPSRVVEMLARGEDPANGYAEVVLRGVKKGS
jgi:soluble lytic murein transglycosylase-like protein